MVYEILDEIKDFLFYLQIFLIIVWNWGLDLMKDLETRIDSILNIEVLISFDANGI